MKTLQINFGKVKLPCLKTIDVLEILKLLLIKLLINCIVSFTEQQYVANFDLNEKKTLVQTNHISKVSLPEDAFDPPSDLWYTNLIEKP